MNLKIKYTSCISSISNEWKLIYINSAFSYFCSLEWHKVVLAFLSKSFITKKLYKLTYFSVCDKDEKIIKLGFFFISKKHGAKTLHFTHLLGPSDYYDILWNNQEPIDYKNNNFLAKIVQDHQADNIAFNHIPKNSISLEMLEAFQIKYKNEIECVAIDLPTDYESYLKTLKSNARQNQRTAVNRLNKSNLNFKFRLLNNSNLDQIDFQMLKEMYKYRNLQKHQNLSWKEKLYSKLNNKFKSPPDMFDLPELKETDFTLGILEIDHKIAAYFFGFERNHKIEINRVVIDNEFKFYSPGIVMFHEYIKQEIPNGLKSIDLTVGDEKYKFDLGGKSHWITNIIASLK